MQDDLQPDCSEWLFKSPHAGGGGTLWRPHYGPHSLLWLNQLSAANAIGTTAIDRKTVVDVARSLSHVYNWAYWVVAVLCYCIVNSI